MLRPLDEMSVRGLGPVARDAGHGVVRNRALQERALALGRDLVRQASNRRMRLQTVCEEGRSRTMEPTDERISRAPSVRTIPRSVP